MLNIFDIKDPDGVFDVCVCFVSCLWSIVQAKVKAHSMLLITHKKPGRTYYRKDLFDWLSFFRNFLVNIYIFYL